MNKQTKQYGYLTNTSSRMIDQRNALRVARAVRNEYQRKIKNETELWMTMTDVMVINKAAELLKLGTYHNPFHGGAAFNISQMPVTKAKIKDWMRL